MGIEEVSLVNSVRVMGKFIYLEGCIYRDGRTKTTESRCRDIISATETKCRIAVYKQEMFKRAYTSSSI